MTAENKFLSLAKQIVDAATAKALRIVTAESCTGGMVAAAITDVPGASVIFDRSFITYSNEAKTELLGVDAALISRFGAVGEEVACAMASGALSAARADIAVAITGIAGPGGGTALKPVGLVWFGVATRGTAARAEHRRFGDLGRAAIRAKATETALRLVLLEI